MTDVTALIPIHRTNGNREWLQQAVNSLRGCEVLILENDGEVAEAFNHGLREATTEYVLPFGADDIADPVMVHELRAGVWDVDVAYPTILMVDEALENPLQEVPAAEFCAMRLLQQNYVSGVSLVRRSKALEVGGFRELPSWEDWDLWVRMSRAGARFKAVPTARLFYRQVEGSRNRMDGVDWMALRNEIIGEGDPTAGLAATFYTSPTPAVSYVRCALPARHMPALTRPGLEVAICEDGTVDYTTHRGAAVFQLGANKSVALLSEQMRSDGIRVLLETDDNYLAGGSKRFRKNAGWGVRIGDAPNTVEGHTRIAREADGVIVTTEFLASQYRNVNPNVYVCPNTVDPADWQPPRKPEDGVFRIGWFASNSHAGDGVLIRRAMEWASRQPGVEVVALGHNPGWRFPYRQLPWAPDLSTYRVMMYGLDVGLAPIVPTPFTRGRSDLKWLEYSMAGAASVVSDIESYGSVPDGLAIKAKDARGFYEAVRHLVQNKDEARRMSAEAREYVLESRTVQGNIGLWREAVAA